MMSTTPFDAPSHPPLRSYWLEARYELLRLLRTPAFALPTLLFPGLFYLLFGVLLGSRGDGKAAVYLLATYGVFGVMGPGLFGFGVTVAIERERGFLTLRRALPAPAAGYLLAKMAMAMAFALVISLVLALLATLAAGVSLQPWQWLLLVAVDVFGVLPFCALGLLVGTVFSGSAAPAAINLIYLPMSFLSGLWLPLSLLPAIFTQLAPAWPAYHLGQIALGVVGLSSGGSVWLHLAVLLVFTVACFALARARLQRAG